jgi:hypothetical protein
MAIFGERHLASTANLASSQRGHRLDCSYDILRFETKRPPLASANAYDIRSEAESFDRFK